MTRFAANLTLMFTEHAFLDRFAAAADAGFDTVEYMFPYEAAPDVVAAALARHKLTQALFNFPGGDFSKGDRGLAALPARQAEFDASLGKALDYAAATNCKRLHVMAGLGAPGDAAAEAAYRGNLKKACDAAAPKDITIVIEPINTRDVPGYFLHDFAKAAAIIAELQRPNLKLLFDIYHRQILHGDVVKGLEALMPVTGHVQIASVPGRNEPGSGELDDMRIFETLDALGYGGVVGLEYRPKAGTVPGLAWMRKLPR